MGTLVFELDKWVLAADAACAVPSSPSQQFFSLVLQGLRKLVVGGG